MPIEPQRWHFGVFPFTSTGQLTPLILLAQNLRDRGHSVTFFEKRKIEGRVRQAGLEFCAIGESEASFKNNENRVTNAEPQSEFSKLAVNLRRILHDLDAYLRSSPAALMRAGVIRDDVCEACNDISLRTGTFKTGESRARIHPLP